MLSYVLLVESVCFVFDQLIFSSGIWFIDVFCCIRLCIWDKKKSNIYGFAVCTSCLVWFFLLSTDIGSCRSPFIFINARRNDIDLKPRSMINFNRSYHAAHPMAIWSPPNNATHRGTVPTMFYILNDNLTTRISVNIKTSRL